MPGDDLVQRTLRNLLITQSYHELSEGMRAVLGPENGTWCTFGTWASKTAGEFVRGDETGWIPKMKSSAVVVREASRIEQALRERFKVTVSLADLAEHVAGKCADAVSLYITEGNRVVFREIGGAYAGFLAAVDAGDTDEFLKTFRPGVPQPDVVTVDFHKRTISSTQQGGQSLLHEMLEYYIQAMQEADAGRKAQLVLCGNALGGIHEQTRLQSYVAGSIDAPIAALFREALHVHVAKGVNNTGRLHDLHSSVDSLVLPAAAVLHAAWRSCATVAMMTMHLPGQTLRLGEDLPAPPGAPLFPPALERIDLPELVDVLTQYDALTPRRHRASNRFVAAIQQLLGWAFARWRKGPVVPGSAAMDWVNLSQRMRFILDFFRSRQQITGLCDPPFTEDQLEAIAAGKVPTGKL